MLASTEKVSATVARTEVARIFQLFLSTRNCRRAQRSNSEGADYLGEGVVTEVFREYFQHVLVCSNLHVLVFVFFSFF